MCQVPNPMMPYSRPGGVATLITLLIVCTRAHLEYNAVIWITAGWHTDSTYRMIDASIELPQLPLVVALSA